MVPCSGPVMGMSYVIMATTVRGRHHATMTTDSRHLSEGNSLNSNVSSAIFGLVRSISVDNWSQLTLTSEIFRKWSICVKGELVTIRPNETLKQNQFPRNITGSWNNGSHDKCIVSKQISYLGKNNYFAKFYTSYTMSFCSQVASVCVLRFLKQIANLMSSTSDCMMVWG